MQTIEEFFDAYERLSAGSGTSDHTAFFAPTFMTASAEGVRVVTPDLLAAVASKRKGLLDRLGRRSSTLIRVDQQPLGPHYVLTSTQWRWHFEPEGGAPFDVTLPTHHILHRTPAGWRIVFYQSGDLMGVLAERGLLPAE